METSSNLGFDESSRTENHRRDAELALLVWKQAFVAIGATMCPHSIHRSLLRDVLEKDLRLIYLDANYEACAIRDPKGLYRKFAAGKMHHFDENILHESHVSEADKRIYTGTKSIEECFKAVNAYVREEKDA